MSDHKNDDDHTELPSFTAFQDERTRENNQRQRPTLSKATKPTPQEALVRITSGLLMMLVGFIMIAIGWAIISIFI